MPWIELEKGDRFKVVLARATDDKRVLERIHPEGKLGRHTTLKPWRNGPKEGDIVEVF